MAIFLIYSWSLLVKSWILSLPPSQPSHRCCRLVFFLQTLTLSSWICSLPLTFSRDPFSNTSRPVCSFTALLGPFRGSLSHRDVVVFTEQPCSCEPNMGLFHGVRGHRAARLTPPSSSPSVHRFSVVVEPGTKLESGPASLHLCSNLLVLTRGVPPITVGHWKLPTLRRYGAVPNGFVFEGGTRCGYCK